MYMVVLVVNLCLEFFSASDDTDVKASSFSLFSHKEVYCLYCVQFLFFFLVTFFNSQIKSDLRKREHYKSSLWAVKETVYDSR